MTIGLILEDLMNFCISVLAKVYHDSKIILYIYLFTMLKVNISFLVLLFLTLRLKCRYINLKNSLNQLFSMIKVIVIVFAISFSNLLSYLHYLAFFFFYSISSYSLFLLFFSSCNFSDSSKLACFEAVCIDSRDENNKRVDASVYLLVDKKKIMPYKQNGNISFFDCSGSCEVVSEKTGYKTGFNRIEISKIGNVFSIVGSTKVVLVKKQITAKEIIFLSRPEYSLNLGFKLISLARDKGFKFNLEHLGERKIYLQKQDGQILEHSLKVLLVDDAIQVWIDNILIDSQYAFRLEKKGFIQIKFDETISSLLERGKIDIDLKLSSDEEVCSFLHLAEKKLSYKIPKNKNAPLILNGNIGRFSINQEINSNTLSFNTPYKIGKLISDIDISKLNFNINGAEFWENNIHFCSEEEYFSLEVKSFEKQILKFEEEMHFLPTRKDKISCVLKKEDREEYLIDSNADKAFLLEKINGKFMLTSVLNEMKFFGKEAFLLLSSEKAQTLFPLSVLKYKYSFFDLISLKNILNGKLFLNGLIYIENLNDSNVNKWFNKLAEVDENISSLLFRFRILDKDKELDEVEKVVDRKTVRVSRGRAVIENEFSDNIKVNTRAKNKGKGNINENIFEIETKTKSSLAYLDFNNSILEYDSATLLDLRKSIYFSEISKISNKDICIEMEVLAQYSLDASIPNIPILFENKFLNVSEIGIVKKREEHLFSKIFSFRPIISSQSFNLKMSYGTEKKNGFYTNYINDKDGNENLVLTRDNIASGGKFGQNFKQLLASNSKKEEDIAFYSGICLASLGLNSKLGMLAFFFGSCNLARSFFTNYSFEANCWEENLSLKRQDESKFRNYAVEWKMFVFYTKGEIFPKSDITGKAKVYREMVNLNGTIEAFCREDSNSYKLGDKKKIKSNGDRKIDSDKNDKDKNKEEKEMKSGWYLFRMKIDKESKSAEEWSVLLKVPFNIFRHSESYVGNEVEDEIYEHEIMRS